MPYNLQQHYFFLSKYHYEKTVYTLMFKSTFPPTSTKQTITYSKFNINQSKPFVSIGAIKGQSGSMSQVVELPNNSYKPITNTAWVRARFCKLQKRCTRLAAASDKVYQLLAHGRWFSPGTPASSTTKTGRHDTAKILLKVALNTKNQSIYV